MPNALLEKALLVMEVYHELDREIADFQTISGLTCQTSCGECCYTATVEVSELEMLPLIFELQSAGTLDVWYQKAEAAQFSGRCVFYSSSDGCGNCLVYESRPLLCRLFGFSGNNDKYGHLRLVTCAHIKALHLKRFGQVEADVTNGSLRLPRMADYVMRVSSVEPDLAGQNATINTAFRRASERVELYEKFNQ